MYSYVIPALWPLYAALFGLCIGSLLNVVIYRLPMMMMEQEKLFCQAINNNLAPGNSSEPVAAKTTFNLFLPRSHCPQCKCNVKPYDNIPVIGWVLLRGRCRNCKSPIHWRYPFIELITMAVALYWASGSLSLLQWFLLLLFSTLLIALTAIDIKHQLLPDVLTYPLLWSGLLWHYLFNDEFLGMAVIGAVAGYMSLWSLYWIVKLLTGREGMGYGDFKLFAALGAWFGWQALPAIALIAACAGMLGYFLWQGVTREGWNQPLPFGPGLALAGFWMSLASPVLNLG